MPPPEAATPLPALDAVRAILDNLAAHPDALIADWACRLLVGEDGQRNNEAPVGLAPGHPEQAR